MTVTSLQYGIPVIKYDRKGFKARPRQLLLTQKAAYVVELAKIKQKIEYSALKGETQAILRPFAGWTWVRWKMSVWGCCLGPSLGLLFWHKYQWYPLPRLQSPGWTVVTFCSDLFFIQGATSQPSGTQTGPSSGGGGEGVGLGSP